MLNNFTKKQQQSLALVLFITLFGIFIAGVIMPITNVFYENQDEIETLTSQLERYNNKIASRESVIEQTTLMQDKIKNAAIFSTQSSIPLALADMQQKIKTAISQAKGEIISTQNIAQKQTEEVTKIGINVRFSGRVETLKNILYELESSKPIIIVETIKITGVRGLPNIVTRNIDPIDKVDVSADLVSFMPLETK